jgi:hypothetical protein
MAFTSENLYSMIGRVQAVRPSLGRERYRQYINDAIRWVINKRPYWVDLRKSGIVSVPNQTITGTISIATGSKQVVGVGTGWPTNDIVNTTLAEPVTAPGGFSEVQLTSVLGLQPDGVLYIDGGTPSAEAVPINLIKGNSVVGLFQFAHNAGATAVQSSLVGQQLRTGYQYPVFTILAVPTPTTLLIDSPWGGLPLVGVNYYIMGMYYSILASSNNANIRKIVAAVDQQQGIPLDTDMTQEELDIRDPQRSDNSDPIAFASRGPSAAGFMQWEIYPGPTSQRQIAFLASLQWPEMITDDSLPPPFLEPTIFTNMAASKALSTRTSKDDPFFDPRLAKDYERWAKEDLIAAINADETLAIQDYKNQYASLLGGPGENSAFWLRHEPSQLDWSF